MNLVNNKILPLLFKIKFLLFLESPASRRALIIGIVLVIVNQMCGCFAFINYTAEIFATSGSTLSPSTSAIVVAFIQLFGSFVSTLITERTTRKSLYVITCLGTIFGLLTFGLHGMLSTFIDTSQFNWIPIVSMSFVIFIASVGLMPLTFTILSEILPLKVNYFRLTI
jgi:MFS family permease